jgi:hypothetical protein
MTFSDLRYGWVELKQDKDGFEEVAEDEDANIPFKE